LTENAGSEIAERVLGRVDHAIRRLAEFPASAPLGRIEGTRELLVAKTPFIVAYRVRNGDVEILAVIHHARRWPDRL
jgi:toxin ParE1/3/4